MKRQLTSFVVILFFVASSVMAAGCRKKRATGPVSGIPADSLKSSRQAVTLPPDSAMYKVIGVVDGIDMFVVQYDQRLFRGGDPYSAQAFEFFKQRGIATIISVTPDDRERDLTRRYGMTLVEIPFDRLVGPTPGDLEKFIDTIKKGQGPFFLHCRSGARRAGALGVAYRMHFLKWPYENALVEFSLLGGRFKDDHGMLTRVREFCRPRL